jgi:hypothetical protein
MYTFQDADLSYLLLLKLDSIIANISLNNVANKFRMELVILEFLTAHLANDLEIASNLILIGRLAGRMCFITESSLTLIKTRFVGSV